MSAHILTDEINSCLMEAVHQYVDKSFDICCGAVTGHQSLAVEGIDRGLDDDIGDGKHGALNTCGQANADNFQERLFKEAHLL